MQALVLKGKLRELVNTIVEGDDYTVQAADEAITALSALRDLKCSASFSSRLEHLPVPPHFRCPISGHIMTDPVILATGQVSLHSPSLIKIKSWILAQGFRHYSYNNNNNCFINMAMLCFYRPWHNKFPML